MPPSLRRTDLLATATTIILVAALALIGLAVLHTQGLNAPSLQTLLPQSQPGIPKQDYHRCSIYEGTWTACASPGAGRVTTCVKNGALDPAAKYDCARPDAIPRSVSR